MLSYLSTNGFKIKVLWTEPPDLVPTRGWYQPPPSTRRIFDLHIKGALPIGHGFWAPDVIRLPLQARLLHAIKTTLRMFKLWRDKLSVNPVATDVEDPSGPLVPPMAGGWDRIATASEVAFVQAAVEKWGPDVAIANYAWMVPALDFAPKRRLPVAALTLDVRHRQLHLRKGLCEPILGEYISRQNERRMLERADALIAIQEAEAAVFSDLFPSKPIVTARMSAAMRPLPMPEKGALLFVGSNHFANVSGLMWFLTHVWPLIRSAIPDAKLFVAGGICTALPIPPPEGVTPLGRLTDLSSAYAKATVVIAPLLQGSGLKIKILEAVSFGRAGVTTSVGAEGLEDLRPSLRVADTPDAFAREAIFFLNDKQLAEDAGKSLVDQARRSLSPQVCYAPVVHLLRNLSDRSKN